jgi:hypothetical protein
LKSTTEVLARNVTDKSSCIDERKERATRHTVSLPGSCICPLFSVTVPHIVVFGALGTLGAVEVIEIETAKLRITTHFTTVMH